MSKLIFFVDDDKMILNLLEYTLANRQDYEIRTYLKGEDCLKDLNLNPDLIVLDLKFRNNGEDSMEGVEILNEIRKRNADQEVAILSGLEDDELKIELSRKGISHFIPKNDYFIDAIMEVIDREL